MEVEPSAFMQGHDFHLVLYYFPNKPLLLDKSPAFLRFSLA